MFFTALFYIKNYLEYRGITIKYCKGREEYEESFKGIQTFYDHDDNGHPDPDRKFILFWYSKCKGGRCRHNPGW